MSVYSFTAYEYHADLVDEDRPSLSSSVIRELVDKTPAHARAVHPRLNPNVVVEEKHEYDVGTVAHALLLEGDAAVEVIEADSWRTNAAKEAAALARSHGRIPLLDKHWQEVQAMSAALQEQLERVECPTLFTDGQAEQTLVWEEQGVLCRARLDWVTNNHAGIHDYKTSTNARPEKWSRGSFFDHGCDIQAAFYIRGVRAVFGTDATFTFAVQEKTAPYLMATFAPAPDVVELANRKIDYALSAWRTCLKRDEWPGYPSRVCFVNLLPWAEGQWFEREAREEVAA